MDETCATATGGFSPNRVTAPVADHTNMSKNADADLFDTSGVEASTFCAGNKTTRYHMLYVQGSMILFDIEIKLMYSSTNVFFSASSTLLIIVYGFRTDFNMDETCPTRSGECSLPKSIAPVSDSAKMFNNTGAGADNIYTSEVEASIFCAANKTTRYQMLQIFL